MIQTVLRLGIATVLLMVTVLTIAGSFQKGRAESQVSSSMPLAGKYLGAGLQRRGAVINTNI